MNGLQHREDYTQQMLSDFKRFIRPDKWEDFKRRRLEDIAANGPIVFIHNVYSLDKKEVLERYYQRESEIGTESGLVLDCVNAGVDNLNMLL